MDTLWGLSGSEFLWSYAGLLLAPAAIGHLWAERQRRAITLSAPIVTTPTKYQLAWLLGGLRRAVETAVATLIERGALHPSPNGVLQVTRVARQPADPFERQVLANAHDVKVGELTSRMRTDPGHVELQRSVERAGLAVPHEWATARRITLAILYTAVLGLGLARLIVSLDEGFPVDYVIALVCVALIADLLATLAVLRRGPKTRRGAQALLEARPTARMPGRAPTHGFGLRGAPAAVLFGGLAVYPDRSIQDAFGYYRRPGMGSGDIWSSDGDGGGCDGD